MDWKNAALLVGPQSMSRGGKGRLFVVADLSTGINRLLQSNPRRNDDRWCMRECTKILFLHIRFVLSYAIKFMIR
jgi:hypothetical protein